MMGDEEHQHLQRQVAVFMPYAAGRIAALKAANKRLAHYSSAENVMNIIKSKTFWLRNTRCMADYSEIDLGYGMLHKFFQQQTNRDAFYKAVNACSPNLAEDSIALFDGWLNDIRFNTYICSVSEHEDAETGHGRLSMWRGFNQGSSIRAAMIMRVPEEGAADGLRVMLSPVAYFGEADVEQQLWDVIGNIRTNRDYLAGLDRDRIKTLIFFTLASAAASIKHIGFTEEKEWRIIYLPRANPSNVIKISVETIAGIPQIVHKIPLDDNPAENVTGISIPALVDRIIVGPSGYQIPIMQAFVQALTDAGVPDAANRVGASGIPLRG
jgi:hypothetical protein